MAIARLTCLSRWRHLSKITAETVPVLSRWYFVDLSILALSSRFLIELLGGALGQMTQLTFCSLSYLASHSRKEESELLIKGKWVAVTTMQRIRIVAPAILLKLQLLTTVDNCWQEELQTRMQVLPSITPCCYTATAATAPPTTGSGRHQRLLPPAVTLLFLEAAAMVATVAQLGSRWQSRSRGEDGWVPGDTTNEYGTVILWHQNYWVGARWCNYWIWFR